MNKKQREEIKKAFQEKRENTVIMVNDAGYKMPIDEYIEEESWRREEINTGDVFAIDKMGNLMYTDVKLTNEDLIKEHAYIEDLQEREKDRIL